MSASEVAKEKYNIVAVHNTPAGNAAFKQVIELLTGVSVTTFLVDPADSIAEIFPRLNERCQPGDRLYIPGYLTFRETRQTRSQLGGLEFLMQARLSPQFETLSQLYAVIGTFQSPETLIRLSPDNGVICAPGVNWLNPLQLFHRLGVLVGPIVNAGDVRKGILPYLQITEYDQQRQSHGLFNRLGVGKFFTECANDEESLNHALAKDFKRLLLTDLWAKKTLVLRPDKLTPVRLQQETLQQVQQGFKKLNGKPVAIQIDDEHALGWSEGIYKLLTGDNLTFEASACSGIAWSKCKRLQCLEDFKVANDLFDEKENALKTSLVAWADAEYKASLAVVALNSSKRTLEELNERISTLTRQVEQTKTALQSIDAKLPKAEQSLEQEFSSFKEFALELVCDDHAQPDDFLTGEKIQAILPSLLKTINSVKSLRQDKKKKEEELDSQTKTLSELASQLEQEEKQQSINQSDFQKKADALKPLDRVTRDFRLCDFVFLDLRLNPKRDQQVGAEEATGMRLLARIKVAFPFLPVIMTTASKQALSSKAARSLGASGYWIKGLQTADDLSQLLKAVLFQSEIWALWMKFLMVKAKREWNCIQQDAGGLRLRVLVSNRCRENIEKELSDSSKVQVVTVNIAARERVEDKLQEALALLFDSESEIVVSKGPNYPYEQVITLLGQIQEERFLKVAEKSWENAYKMIDQRYQATERQLRRKRNEVAHDRVAYKTRSDARVDALKFLGHTLEMLLKERRKYAPDWQNDL